MAQYKNAVLETPCSCNLASGWITAISCSGKFSILVFAPSYLKVAEWSFSKRQHVYSFKEHFPAQCTIMNLRGNQRILTEVRVFMAYITLVTYFSSWKRIIGVLFVLGKKFCIVKRSCCCFKWCEFGWSQSLKKIKIG